MGAVNPSSLSFGKQHVGKTSAAQTVTLSNTGNASLIVTTIATTAGFTQTSNCTTLAPGGTCSISVRFAPAAKGSAAGTLKVNDNAANTPQIVTLSGTGF